MKMKKKKKTNPKFNNKQFLAKIYAIMIIDH